ncbi:ATP-grasp domain-containing protein [Romboutsia sp. 1001713B170207_170306_H8]|uniref:ATP-grasp domain-containing protein n=1 Tax=Romboutsia sp. 1001713B170207_170306_H8 TaxID=2787112 RepID=UPI0018982B32|nr:ATP-grasp domain-containing protein [Romboutsia sp. 1001713B170207_170306_H8]
MNVIFISPNFPLYFYNFCNRLKERGVNVLGIGDTSYNDLSMDTINSLTEYYKVNSLENFDEVSEACLFFINKYGKIDWIESQNEYWLETEAALRSKFDVSTGTKIEYMAPMKYKSKMKEVYKSCGIPVARYEFITDYNSAINFTNIVGYPVVVKPDNGVGASNTYKLRNDEELGFFFETKNNNITYIIEEFINGHVETFDGITDSNKNILIASSHVMLSSIMDAVNEDSESAFYSQDLNGMDIEWIGDKVVKAFDTRSRFFHFEFFRLDEDKEGLGKKGDIVGLEVNMRAPGAYIPDMINMAYDVDTYSIWADMLIYDKIFTDVKRKCLVGYASRRNGVNYKYKNDDIKHKYKEEITYDVEVPEVLSAAMGNHVFLFKAKSKEGIMDITKFILEHK